MLSRVLSTALILNLISAAAVRAEETKPVGYAESQVAVDIRDLVDPKEVGTPSARLQAIVDELIANPVRFFPEGVQFQIGGPSKPFATRSNVVYGMELSSLPVSYSDGATDFYFNALLYREDLGIFFRRLLVRVDGDTHPRVSEIRQLEDISIADTVFSIEVGLLQRKAILKDQSQRFKKVYPLGVGSFDEAVASSRVRLLTPRYKDAYLLNSKSTAMFSRTDPAYFKGKPFLKVITSEGVYQGIAFHTTQSEPDMRGFYSHGCMRVRDKDLYEMWMMVTTHGSQKTSVNIDYLVDDPTDHVYPTTNTRYNTVDKCNATRTGPCKDKDGLTQTKTRHKAPPVEMIDVGKNAYGPLP